MEQLCSQFTNYFWFIKKGNQILCKKKKEKEKSGSTPFLPIPTPDFHLKLTHIRYSISTVAYS